MGEVIPLIPKQELTDDQEIYWWAQLEIAERQVEYARRMLRLGSAAVERGVGESPENK